MARDGTFTGAGAQLGLTQSAVSAQIRRLEDYLGVELFGGARRLLNASTGARCCRRPRSWWPWPSAWPAPAARGRRGSLRIGAIASVQQDLLVRALGLFRAQYPDVRAHRAGVSCPCWGRSMPAKSIWPY